MNAPRIATERLLLRPFKAADAADVQHLAGDPRVGDTTARMPQPFELSDAIAWIASLRATDARGRVTWAIVVRDAGALIGSIGLKLEHDEPARTIATLDFWIGVRHWNHGYATEAARAALRYGFDELGLKEIVAIHMTRNPASGRVLEKLGMRHIGSSVDIARDALESIERYSIGRARYLELAGLG